MELQEEKEKLVETNEETKTLRVNLITWRRLNSYKGLYGLKTFENIINFLLDKLEKKNE